jgi:hypothetical protein
METWGIEKVSERPKKSPHSLGKSVEWKLRSVSVRSAPVRFGPHSRGNQLNGNLRGILFVLETEQP